MVRNLARKGKHPGWIAGCCFSWLVLRPFFFLRSWTSNPSSRAELRGYRQRQRVPMGRAAAPGPRQGEVSGSRRAGGEPQEQGRVGVPQEIQQHPTANPLPTYRGRWSSSLQHPALPLPALKSFAIRCFGLSFLLCRGLSECEAILVLSGFSYCSINFSSLILTFLKGNLC